MKINDLNTVVREELNQLIQKGYPKHPICSVTLGTAANPQFDRFMKGIDLGVIPMARIFEGFGYELCVIPVKKDNAETKKFVEASVNDAVTDVSKSLVDFLENRQTPLRANTSGVSLMVGETVKEMIFQL